MVSVSCYRPGRLTVVSELTIKSSELNSRSIAIIIKPDCVTFYIITWIFSMTYRGGSGSTEEDF